MGSGASGVAAQRKSCPTLATPTGYAVPNRALRSGMQMREAEGRDMVDTLLGPERSEATVNKIR